MRATLQDVRYTLRRIYREPAFTALAVLTLALGIGASTAMFGVLNAVLFRPIPFSHPDRLVRIFSMQRGNVLGPSPMDLRDFAAQNHTFEKMAVYDVWRKNISFTGESIEPEQMRVGLVPREYFEILDVKLFTGRLFRDEENRWGNNFVAIISYNLWQTRLHADRAILGKTIRINDEPYTIVGVTSREIPDFWVGTPKGKTELWTPFVPYLDNNSSVWTESSRGDRGWGAVGRLNPGVTIEQANVDLQRIASNLATQYPADRGVGVQLQPLQEDQVRNLRPVLRLLMGAVVLILLIACSNVANLLLVRNSARTREIALRKALGAETWIVIRQFVIENLALGSLGGIIGCAVAWWACATVSRVHPAQLPQLSSVTVDFPVLVFTFLVSIFSSGFSGTVPVLVTLKVSPAQTFKETGRTNAVSRSRKHLGRMFVASEIAFAVMLVVGTGLLLQSLLHLQNQGTGFRPDHLLRTRLFLSRIRYPSIDSITRFCDEYVARVRQLPGVLDATISAASPPDDQWTQNFTIDGRPVSPLDDTPVAARNTSDSHYFRTLGIPLIQGRDFSDSDTETSPPAALVNEAFVRAYFPAEDPVGKKIRISVAQQLGSRNSADEVFTIVGVSGDAMNRGPALPPMPHFTTLFRQTPDLNSAFKTLIVRTALDPSLLAASIREQLHLLDANLPFAEVATMDELIEQQTADRRYTTGLLTLFAALGLLLAGVGVYGVVSYVVDQRTSEIGLRMALGAQRADVVWLVVRQGIEMAVAGAAVGLMGAWLFRKAVAQLVFAVSPADPITFLAAAAGLIALAAGACFIPARRAIRIDPMMALRYE
ncbi:MAG: ABC transporter permease [Acidobacteria bacterium]|nr:ABC transporter permease [Acidobacteriota bacterium]